MPRDIDIIRDRLAILLPDVKIEQLKVVHPGADDDGLWYFRRPGKMEELQIESSTYDVPFIVEADTAPAWTASTVEEVIEAVRKFFSPP